MEPENSWIEVLRHGEELDITDINANADVLFVVSGALEFTMREDPLVYAREQYLAERDNTKS